MTRSQDISYLCIWCFKPFDPEESEYNGHNACAEQYEVELDKKMIEELIAACPSGTRFDLAGGAACD